MSDSFLSYWRNLEAIIPVKVDLVEAGLASGLSRAADPHGGSQASCLGHRDSPQGEPPPTSQRTRHPTARGGTHYDATARFVTAANSLYVDADT